MKVQLNTIRVTPAVQAAAYAGGDVIGGKMTFTGLAKDNRAGYITGAIVSFKDVLPTQILDLFIFGTDPTNSTFTENAAIDINVADFAKLLGVIQVAAADWIGDAAGAVATKTPKIPFKGTAGEEIYAVGVIRGTGITPASTSSMSIALTGDQN